MSFWTAAGIDSDSTELDSLLRCAHMQSVIYGQ